MKTALTCCLLAVLVTLCLTCGAKIVQPSDLPQPSENHPETTYVMVEPAWTEADGIGFVRPSDVKVGYDRYVYVADRGNNRVVKLTQTGEYIESYAVLSPTQVTQDRALALLVVSDSNLVWRRSYLQHGEFEIAFRAPDVTLPPPQPQTVPAVLYGIAASPFPDRDYYLSLYYYDRIGRFAPADTFKSFLVPVGIGAGKTYHPVCINTFEYSGNYYICYTSGSANYGIQVIDGFTRLPVIPDTDSAQIYRATADGHKDIAMDQFGNVFVSMESRSEVWKFTRGGRLSLKFGQTGPVGARLNRPRGIDVYGDYLYIADTGNGRVLRFQASTSPEP